ncbi:unnamed protein product [Lepeophtheirus salmonis]|uniref:(salmon louse) hypothetical protein n=1 Tax=Lepeophtheirus salmonis TaxID=72036 RepID=A0A817FG05_LEPSM|nr:unnamed protein product [Lepeophtheirus salmonis]CAG9478509.1 unnamed protein product [Lepeophtheirus salmonis]
MKNKSKRLFTSIVFARLCGHWNFCSGSLLSGTSVASLCLARVSQGIYSKSPPLRRWSLFAHSWISLISLGMEYEEDGEPEPNYCFPCDEWFNQGIEWDIHVSSCGPRDKYLTRTGLGSSCAAPLFAIGSSGSESESESMMCHQCDHLFDMREDLESHQAAYHNVLTCDMYRDEHDGEELERVVIDEAVLPTSMPLSQGSYEHFVLDSERVCEVNQNSTTPDTHLPLNKNTMGSLTRSPSITSLTIVTSTKEGVGKGSGSRGRGNKNKNKNNNVSQEKSIPPPIPRDVGQWLVDVLEKQHPSRRGVLDDFLDDLGFILLSKCSTDIPSKAQEMLTPPESQNVSLQSGEDTGINTAYEGCFDDDLNSGRPSKTAEHVPISRSHSLRSSLTIQHIPSFKKACGDCKEKLAASKTVLDGCPPGPGNHRGLPPGNEPNDGFNVTPPPDSPDQTSSCDATNSDQWSVVEVDLHEAVSTDRKTEFHDFRNNGDLFWGFICEVDETAQRGRGWKNPARGKETPLVLSALFCGGAFFGKQVCLSSTGKPFGVRRICSTKVSKEDVFETDPEPGIDCNRVTICNMRSICHMVMCPAVHIPTRS